LKYNKLLFIVIASLIVSSCNKESICIDADTVIFNTKIYTANDYKPEAEAVAIKGKNFIFVGSNKDVESYKCNASSLLDLGGLYVFPGFIDAHAHLKSIGYRELTLNLQGAKSLKDMLAAVEIFSNKKLPGEWVVGRGWIEKKWPEARFPTLEEIDRFSSDKPVVLERADGHAVIANSFALNLAGITSTTPSPHGGAINKDKDGNLTGVLVDKASFLVEQLIPKKTISEDKEALEVALRISAQLGWTQIQDAGSPFGDFQLLQQINKEGNLDIRIQMYLGMDGSGHAEVGNSYTSTERNPVDTFLDEGPYLDDEHMLSSRGIKLYADGAIGSRGAAFLDKYNDYDTDGFLIFKKETTMPILLKALRNGIQIQTHAIGDRGNRITLDWYEEAFKEIDSVNRLIEKPRWRIEHSQNIQPEDQVRFKDMDIIASMQPSHAIGDLHFAGKRLGIERLSNAYVWKSLIDQGVIVAGGSDAPVEIGDPRIEFKAAISRTDLEGYSGEGWHLEEVVSRQEALKMFTIWPSFSVFEEDIKGSVEVGKLADLTIFSKDIMTIPAEEIMSSENMMTIVSGKVVYSR
jgi:predicted amidohydrolase YtcJ|tara:strand:+ start:3434 stop:5161 length:1728 start_codon:yes stop_codon:yes gene_type:complete